ncbi:CCA tRNA nucleotidyltransferase [Fusobacterium sp. PH5-44]|uniref:CCA tRNA nucleotidyltransferase n=1 Tax=unclassified Fusobacterium TaxID=2648384 RepID=UPI003D1EB548
MEKIILEKEIKDILYMLQKNGTGYIVGGYIRDKLLNFTPKDCDFCTNICYRKLLEIFKDFSPVLVGKSFGVVKIKYNGNEYDIAQMRKDTKFTNNRRNTSVEFIDDILSDLNRRDFTVNAIAYDGYDLVPVNDHALNDISEKTIRFIGKPEERIKEDPLRIFRGIRLFVEKSFNSFEHNTLYQMKIKASYIDSLSSERIRDEFIKIIMSPNPKLGIIYLLKCDLLQRFLPELYACYNFMQNNPHHHKDIFEHTLLVLENTTTNLILRLAALFHDIGKIQTYSEENGIGHFYSHDKIGAVITKNILKRLQFDSKTIEKVAALVRYHMAFHTVISKKFAKKIISEVGNDNLDNLFLLCKADILGSFPPHDFSNLDNSIEIIRKILNEKEPISLKDLKINGNDLILLGINNGRHIGIILNFLLEHILEYPEDNQKDFLIKLVKNKFLDQNIL